MLTFDRDLVPYSLDRFLSHPAREPYTAKPSRPRCSGDRMRKRFSWYLPPSPEELATIWSRALVSVDANVLLDLYRYHGEVRTQILDALRYFEGRLWLTNQAAEEFIRNRTAVISKTSAEYDSANKLLKEFDKSLTHLRDALRGNRLVPDTV